MSGPGRHTYETDTMMVAVLDPSTGSASLISIPRDTYGTPLGDGRNYNLKLNSLLAYARLDSSTYPLGPTETLKTAVGALLDIHIDYIAAVDFLGFTSAVDAVGGVDITVTRAVHDYGYRDEYNNLVGFHIEPGTYHMNGYEALAFARSRKGAGDNDFTRADRQQQVIQALVTKMRGGSWLFNLPDLFNARQGHGGHGRPGRAPSGLARRAARRGPVPSPATRHPAPVDPGWPRRRWCLHPDPGHPRHPGRRPRAAWTSALEPTPPPD